MPRWGATLVVALVLAWGAAGAGAGAAAAQAGVEGAIGDIDAFWAGAFAEAGWPYSSPGVVAITELTETECGVFTPWIVAGYCPLDGTIYYSALVAGEIAARGDDFALTTIIAHEWGHHAQFLLGQFDVGSFELEQQADCLAGAYAQDAAVRGVISTAEISEAVRVTALSGDASWLPEDAPGAHGSGPQRATAFMNGYTGGIDGCGLEM